MPTPISAADLEQQLLQPLRTQGGYRLYRREDVERLRTILQLQRDEFLPLKVIRQEIDGNGGAMSPLVALRAFDRVPKSVSVVEDLSSKTSWS